MLRTEGGGIQGQREERAHQVILLKNAQLSYIGERLARVAWSANFKGIPPPVPRIHNL
jgi:hypothetical protein